MCRSQNKLEMPSSRLLNQRNIFLTCFGGNVLMKQTPENEKELEKQNVKQSD